jgi:hypothetical protein
VSDCQAKAPREIAGLFLGTASGEGFDEPGADRCEIPHRFQKSSPVRVEILSSTHRNREAAIQSKGEFMALDELKKRFVDEIKLRAYDDKYVDRNEEREILQIAIQQGISIDSARSALATVCEAQGYVLESALLKLIKDQVEAAMGNDGKIDQKEFELIFQNARKAAQSRKSDREVKKMVVLVMEDTGNNKVKTGWFSDWYTNVKRDLGMA